jgi:UDP-N-acetylmuramoyl-tripeptide--D-alanyl-D-alanine ligase
MFFALKGPNFNGNAYVQQALDAGAAYCVVDEEIGLINEHCQLVPDVLQALQSLAAKHRMQFDIPFIAITGSNGKTTTKELVNEVLSKKFKTYTTEGNLNNHIGVPLTILKIRKDAEIAVIEMGANHQKEIASYCEYAMPTHGLITNIGKAHLEGFGGVEGVKKGKAELFDYLRVHNGVAFIFADYDYLHEISQGVKYIISYGENKGDIMGKAVPETNFLSVKITAGAGEQTINTNLVGDYNLPNVLAAFCVGKTFLVEEPAIKSALEQYKPSNSRSQLMELDSNKIILDAYNANPSSMKAAIQNFAGMDGDNKVLILGAMMELGDTSDAEHKAIVEMINGYKWNKVVLVGKSFLHINPAYLQFETVEQARDWFQQEGLKNMQLLIKGSRSMQMEKVLEK